MCVYVCAVRVSLRAFHFDAQSAALRTRRADLEAALLQEEQELARISDEARSKVSTCVQHVHLSSYIAEAHQPT